MHIPLHSGRRFRLIPAIGHRCDHSVLNVFSSSDQLLHISDAVAHPLFLAQRGWYSTYDSDPAQAVITKQQLLDWCASEKALVVGAHFPFPGIGYVQQQDKGWRWYSGIGPKDAGFVGAPP